MTVRFVSDPRRWMAFRSVGTYELLMEIQGGLEDFVGAVRDGRPRVAAYTARQVVLRCLAIRALGARGEIPDAENPFCDQLSGLPPRQAAEGLTLMRDIAAGVVEDPIELLTEYVRGFARELGFETPPPSVRRPEGLYPALRLARELLPLNEASGYPIAMPAAWLPAHRPERPAT